MKKNDILYCIKEIGRDIHLHYKGDVYSETGYHEYSIFYEKDNPYLVNGVWPESKLVSIWIPIKDAVKLGLSPSAKADTVFSYNDNNDHYTSLHLWDYFVTEGEYKNKNRTELIDRMSNG